MIYIYIYISLEMTRLFIDPGLIVMRVCTPTRDRDRISVSSTKPLRWIVHYASDEIFWQKIFHKRNWLRIVQFAKKNVINFLETYIFVHIEPPPTDTHTQDLEKIFDQNSFLRNFLESESYNTQKIMFWNIFLILIICL